MQQEMRRETHLYLVSNEYEVKKKKLCRRSCWSYGNFCVDSYI